MNPYVTKGPGSPPSPVCFSVPGQTVMGQILELTAGGYEIRWPDGTLSFRPEWPRDICPPPEEWPKVRITNGDPPRLGPGRRAWKRVIKEQQEEADFEIPYEDCAYYRRYYALPGADPHGICSFGCRDEPACITSFPPPC